MKTRYGSTRISPKSYFVHHTQRITKAAVMHDAKAILKQVVALKQRCLRTGTAAHAAATGGVGPIAIGALCNEPAPNGPRELCLRLVGRCVSCDPDV